MNKKRKESKADTLEEEVSHVDSRQKVKKKKRARSRSEGQTVALRTHHVGAK